MARYLIARALSTVPVLLLVTIAAFSLILLLPGDPVLALVSDQGMTQEAYERARRELGLDQPAPIQYINWLGRVIRGDWGRSTASKQPVLEAIAQRLPVTLTLAGCAWVVGVLVAFPAGLISALRRGSWLDLLASSGALVGVAVPGFWLGILLILVFSVRLGWLPSSGFVSPWTDPAEGVRRLILPAVTLGLALSAVTMRQIRSSLLEVLSEDYVRTARSKGLRETRVVVVHALRNALLPVVTVMGLQIAHILAGSVIIEQVFAIPGMGRFTVQGILTRDFPAVQGGVLAAGLVVVTINLITDLLYAVLDPRIRYT